MYGISENYLYATGNVQQLLFYGGTSWENISGMLGITDPYLKFKNAWTDGYETMVVGYGAVGGIQKTIIWQGK